MNFSKSVYIAVDLSFLMRERDRDFLNVSDRDLVQYGRFGPFTVPNRS